MGKVVHVPPGPAVDHRHEEPPKPKGYTLGTIWQCSCGAQRKLSNDQREGLIWVWTLHRWVPPAEGPTDA